MTLLQCDYYDRQLCRSCTLIRTPVETQLADNQARCEALLPRVDHWLPLFTAGYRGFRNRVKLVVGGASGNVRLGILGDDGEGIDLRECAIQSPEIARVLPAIADFVNDLRIEPYSVPRRRGELKFVHLTVSPDAEFMVRFVVRTERARQRIRDRLVALRAVVPEASVISVNLLPEHRAVLEGDDEEVLHGNTLLMRVGEVPLHLLPQSFFQTNTVVAQELYRQVANWVDEVSPASVWDLYCGVGGFALHCAAPGRAVLGVEVSEAAVKSAERSAHELGVDAVFLAADATTFSGAGGAGAFPELVIVNPPRRGIGADLAGRIEGSSVRSVVYSSCNAESLARDLAAMPSFDVCEGRVFDMFPHTRHLEVAVLLERRGAAHSGSY